MYHIKPMLALVLAVLLLCAPAFAQENQTLWADFGEGSNEMTLVVVFPDLTTKGYRIHSDQPTMLAALLELKLVKADETEGVMRLVEVDGCALPKDNPDAYWFVSMHDPSLDSLTPAEQPLDQLPLAGQTYAFGMINSEAAHE
ncbi:MAG: hypothetical protein E7323_02035 [Clostridiales bacterium]|nr:hypothetical protein [Clostridiales bacterium]